jgi:hypothetical protein
MRIFQVSLDTLTRSVPTAPDSTVYLNTTPTADKAAVTAQLDHLVSAYPQVRLQSQADYQAQVHQQVNAVLYLIDGLLALAIAIAILGEVNAVLYLIDGLLALAIAIAILGVVNTLALSVIQRMIVRRRCAAAGAPGPGPGVDARIHDVRDQGGRFVGRRVSARPSPAPPIRCPRTGKPDMRPEGPGAGKLRDEIRQTTPRLAAETRRRGYPAAQCLGLDATTAGPRPARPARRPDATPARHPHQPTADGVTSVIDQAASCAARAATGTDPGGCASSPRTPPPDSPPNIKDRIDPLDEPR